MYRCGDTPVVDTKTTSSILLWDQRNRGSPRAGGWLNDPLFEHSFDMLLDFITTMARAVWAEADGSMVFSVSFVLNH